MPRAAAVAARRIHPPADVHAAARWHWPVAGGGYISQYFHYGHPALDIAAPYGSRVVAAAAGTVIFAGWKDDTAAATRSGSRHGSGLYTTYNHMSAVTRDQSASTSAAASRSAGSA